MLGAMFILGVVVGLYSGCLLGFDIENDVSLSPTDDVCTDRKSVV